MMASDGGSIIPVYKPRGITSFEVVRIVRRELNLKKVGHAGTLDPLAEGLLILLTGSKTKMMDELLKVGKEYVATLKLGSVSKSHDLETELVVRAPYVKVSETEIRESLKKYRGQIEQVPPEYSAAWVNGKRAYNLAREGVRFKLKPKVVTISEIEVVSYISPALVLRIACSSGTYVRSLARDIGEDLGCGAVLTELVRTRIGPYSVENAIRLDELKLRFAS
ncbi:MAG TPA: tRNA pseudouridine(55) synthase TruB [Candidatus Kryptonia bacterium]